MYILQALSFLLLFAPAMILVLLGIRGKRVHVNAIYAVSAYTLAWGIFLLVSLLPHNYDDLGLWLMLLSIAIVGITLLMSTRNIRLAKLSAAIAIVATLLLPFTLN